LPAIWFGALDLERKTDMNLSKLLAIAVAASFIALPAVAQTQAKAGDEQNGHHYAGGPKTEVPHHMGKKDMGPETADADKKGPSGSHHYSGGPATDVPHHTGAK
jgi:hypothetical protein